MTTGAGAAGSSCPTCGQLYPTKSGYCSNDGSKLVEIESAPVAEHLLGCVLDGRFRIDSIAGLGGMANVYRATQLSIDREVLVKVFHPSVIDDPDVAARLLAVGRLACQITAPSIANTFDFGRARGPSAEWADGIVYLATELVRGRTLAEEIGGRALAARRVVAIAMQILDALESAQKQGLAHGNLTPSNVMITDESSRRDVVKVIDFGLAPPPSKIVTTHEVRRARYRAPEQFENRPTDARSDLYALGCIMYEALTGTAPFNDHSIDILRNRHLTAQPPKLPPNVPLPLAAIVEKLLAKAPDHRYRFFVDVKRALEPLHVSTSTPVTGLPVAAGARVVDKSEITALTAPPGTVLPHPPYPSPQPMPPQPAISPTASSSRRVLVIAIVAIVLSAIGIAGYLLAA